jgi:hypothetical protein
VFPGLEAVLQKPVADLSEMVGPVESSDPPIAVELFDLSELSIAVGSSGLPDPPVAVGSSGLSIAAAESFDLPDLPVAVESSELSIAAELIEMLETAELLPEPLKPVCRRLDRFP